jgi:hypothetical protein
MQTACKNAFYQGRERFEVLGNENPNDLTDRSISSINVKPTITN